MYKAGPDRAWGPCLLIKKKTRTSTIGQCHGPYLLIFQLRNRRCFRTYYYWLRTNRIILECQSCVILVKSHYVLRRKNHEIGGSNPLVNVIVIITKKKKNPLVYGTVTVKNHENGCSNPLVNIIVIINKRKKKPLV